MPKSELIGIALLILAIVIFVVWRLTVGPYKRAYSKKMRKLWGQGTYYWEAVITLSTLITVVLLFFLRWIHVMDF